MTGDDSQIPGGTEQRRAPRISRRFILRVAQANETPAKWSVVTIQNLSASGIFFTYDRNAHEGMALQLRIDFPNRVVSCLARVVRVIGTSKGVMMDVAARFEGLSADDSAYVEKFVLSNLPVKIPESRSDNRLYRRFVMRVAATGQDPLVWSVVTIRDISVSGILFSYDRATHEDMKLHLRIDFPDRVISCIGRVVRGDDSGLSVVSDVAVQFEQLAPQDILHIQKFVADNQQGK